MQASLKEKSNWRLICNNEIVKEGVFPPFIKNKKCNLILHKRPEMLYVT